MDASRATPDSVKAVQNAMVEQVKALRSGDFSDDDLECAKRYLIGKHALNHERTRDRAYYLGLSEILGLGYQADLPNTYRDRLNRVTREDIIRVCTRYLSDPVMVVSSK
jgi:zinc protease